MIVDIREHRQAFRFSIKKSDDNFHMRVASKKMFGGRTRGGEKDSKRESSKEYEYGYGERR